MRTLVIGGGAVGSVLTAYLTRGGRDVTMADGWWQHVRAAREGLLVEAVEEDVTVPVRAIDLEELAGYGAADLVVIAGKSYDTRMLALLAREHLAPHTVVVSAQNGMNDELVGSVVGPERMVGSIVLMAVHLTAPGVVRRTTSCDRPSVAFGPLHPGGPDVGPVAELFAPLGGVRTIGDAWPERWSKLALNTMSNAPAGVVGCTTHELWSDSGAVQVLVALAHEVALVATAAGVTMSPMLGTIDHALLGAATGVGTAAWGEVVRRIGAVGDYRQGKRANYPSLVQDVQKGRRTEVEHLNGRVVAEGARLGVPTPTHDDVIAALRPVEAGLVPPSWALLAPVVEAVLGRYR